MAALLSLALAPAGPHCLRSAAYAALLLHPSLQEALSAAELVSEEELEQSEVESSDSIGLLEQVCGYMCGCRWLFGLINAGYVGACEMESSSSIGLLEQVG